MQVARTEQDLIRIEKLNKILEKGYPFPNDVKRSHTAQEVVALAPTGEAQECWIAGRIMTMRNMGKACFCHVQDRSGRVQVYVRKDEIGEEAFEEFLTFDLGDIVSFRGTPFVTRSVDALRAPDMHYG